MTRFQDSFESAQPRIAVWIMILASSSRHSAHLNEAELNRWIRDNLAIASSHEAQQAGLPIPSGHEATVREARSAMKDIRLHLTTVTRRHLSPGTARPIVLSSSR